MPQHTMSTLLMQPASSPASRDAHRHPSCCLRLHATQANILTETTSDFRSEPQRTGLQGPPAHARLQLHNSRCSTPHIADLQAA